MSTDTSTNSDGFDFSNPTVAKMPVEVIIETVIDQDVEEIEWKTKPAAKSRYRPQQFSRKNLKLLIFIVLLLVFISSSVGYLVSENSIKGTPVNTLISTWLSSSTSSSSSSSIFYSILNGNGFSIQTAAPVPSTFLISKSVKKYPTGDFVTTSIIEGKDSQQSFIEVSVQENSAIRSPEEFSKLISKLFPNTTAQVNTSSTMYSSTLSNSMEVRQTEDFLYIITTQLGSTTNASFVTTLKSGLILN